MEFAGSAADHESKPVFDLWRERFHAARLPFPKVVFWNIGSRTQAVPMLESDAGVLLASGYSEKTLERLLAGDLAPRDPWEALKEVLDDPRYAAPFG